MSRMDHVRVKPHPCAFTVVACDAVVQIGDARHPYLHEPLSLRPCCYREGRARCRCASGTEPGRLSPKDDIGGSG